MTSFRQGWVQFFAANRKTSALSFAVMFFLAFYLLLITRREFNRMQQRNYHGASDDEASDINDCVCKQRRPWKECTANRNVHYWSMSWEDKTIFEMYFSNPVHCSGTFLEIGALDGTTFSNSLFFEKYLGWTGILIEAEPSNIAKLKKRRLATQNFYVAICPNGTESIDIFGDYAMAHLKESSFYAKGQPKNKVPCKTLAQVIHEAGVKMIDFFILDVEGVELMALETMDWSIPVKVFVIEMGRSTSDADSEQDHKIIDLLMSKGYSRTSWDVRAFCKPGEGCMHNVVFENKQLV